MFLFLYFWGKVVFINIGYGYMVYIYKYLNKDIKKCILIKF